MAWWLLVNRAETCCHIRRYIKISCVIQILLYNLLQYIYCSGAQNFRYHEMTWWSQQRFLTRYGVKLHLLRTHSLPMRQRINIETAPISTLENVSTVWSPMTHPLLHKSRVPKPHKNSTIITSFVNRYTSSGFNYQTHNTWQNCHHPHVLETTYLTLPPEENARASEHEQNSGVTSFLN
jgi:hypothetical protein